MTIPVIVDLKVEVNADSKLIIFAEAPAVGNNVIESTFNVPSAAFNGLIEFWGVTVGGINSHLDLTEVGGNVAYKTTAVSLYNNIKSVLNSSFDCKDAEPFKTTGNAYHNQANFGKVALGQVTNEVFGHVAATAAITNDEEYVTYMLNGDLSTTWDNIYAYGSQQSISKPNLANALVRTLMMYGYKKDASNADIEIKDEVDAPRLTLIAKQVIGQDPSRAQGTGHIKLSFYPGDVVFMTINVSPATLSLSNAGPNDTPEQKAAAIAATKLTPGSARKFDLKITIS
jgi:hypothetical protein